MTVELFQDLEWRGLLQDRSDDEIAGKLPAGAPFYVGFDPTATSLQLGNLIPLLVSARMAQEGYKPIILFGGATGSIGDPSGKNKERQLLSREEIQANVDTQKAQTEAIYERIGITATFVDNFDWTKDVTMLEFLRDIGKHFTVNYMLAKEVVKSRVEGAGISFTEFSYMTLQAFDYLHLFKHHGCRLQIGGSDQWGNITAGLELIRRKNVGEAFAFSFPLLTNSQGKKFGKSEDGAIWLDPKLTSPYKLHQFWLNTDDSDVIRYIKIFTFLDKEKVAELERCVEQAPEKRLAQKTLADEVCTLIHGKDATEDAKRSAQVLFGGSLEGLSTEQLEEIFSDVPSSSLPLHDTRESSLLDLFVNSGAISSKGECKRLIKNGGAYLNNERITDGALSLKEALPEPQELLVLRTGKKKYHLVKLLS